MSAMIKGIARNGIVHYARRGGPQAMYTSELVRECLTIRGNRITLEITGKPVTCKRCLAKRPNCKTYGHKRRKATGTIRYDAAITQGRGVILNPACGECIKQASGGGFVQTLPLEAW